MAGKQVGEDHMSATGKRKPMTVAAIIENTEPPAPSVADTLADRTKRSGGQRRHVKQLTLYLPHPVYKQLRELAFYEERRMHSLLMESLDRLFVERGMRSIEQITRGG
jgi:hypothetical protein